MEIMNKTIEEMLASGEIIEIGEVVIEAEEPEVLSYAENCEKGIPAALENKGTLFNGKIPDLVICTKKADEPKPVNIQEPAAAPLFTYFVKADSAQKRLRNLAAYLFPEPKISFRIANAFGRTTERDRISAFGNYFADFMGNENFTESNGYVNPAQFLVKAELALVSLKSGNNSGRPIRKSIRDALAGKDETVYDSIRQKLPEIARAIATTGFAVELCKIYSDACRARKSAFEYASGIRAEKQLEEIARQANYTLYR